MTQSNRTADVEALLSELGENPSFLSTTGRALVTLPNTQNFFLDDTLLTEWLENASLPHTGALPSHAALAGALHLLRVRAHTCGTLTPVALRIAAHPDGGVLLDLANARNEIAQVTPHGCTLTTISPGPAFVSVRGLLPIPAPDLAAHEPTIDPLRPLLNCAPEASDASEANDASWNGIVDWLTAALHPDRPCPVLILYGPPGSGKTTAARLLRTLIDPNCQPLAALPSRGPALERYAESHHVLAFDHITRMSGSTTDALCRLSSGAIGPSHPIILTVPRMDATDWQPRPDLAARALAVHLSAIDNPRPPKELEAEFENLRPTLLSALLTKVTQPVSPTPKSDAAKSLLTASAQQDPLYKSIHNFMQAKEQWTGTATDLFNEICVTASPRALSHRLRILAPTLPLIIEFRRTHNGLRQITMTKVGQTPWSAPWSAADPPVGPRAHNHRPAPPQTPYPNRTSELPAGPLLRPPAGQQAQPWPLG